MMICPDWKTCKASVQGCPEAQPHRRDSWCKPSGGKCPACISYEKPQILICTICNKVDVDDNHIKKCCDSDRQSREDNIWGSGK